MPIFLRVHLNRVKCAVTRLMSSKPPTRYPPGKMIFHHEPVGAQTTSQLRKNWFWAFNNPSSTWAIVPQKTRIMPKKRQTTVRRNDEKKSISHEKTPSLPGESSFRPFAPGSAGGLACEPLPRFGGDSRTVVDLLALTGHLSQIITDTSHFEQTWRTHPSAAQPIAPAPSINKTRFAVLLERWRQRDAFWRPISCLCL